LRTWGGGGGVVSYLIPFHATYPHIACPVMWCQQHGVSVLHSPQFLKRALCAYTTIRCLLPMLLCKPCRSHIGFSIVRTRCPPLPPVFYVQRHLTAKALCALRVEVRAAQLCPHVEVEAASRRQSHPPCWTGSRSGKTKA
jgi:hypothetical protein